MDKLLLEQILKKLKKKGAHEADIIFSHSANKSSSCRLGKIEKTEESEIKEIGIRVIKDKKQAIISSTNIEPENISKLVERVIEMVKVVPKDEFCGLYHKDLDKIISERNNSLNLMIVKNLYKTDQ